MNTENCEKCEKPVSLCVCEGVSPLPTRTHVLILQHPQEPDRLLGSARLAHLSLENSTLKVGLSWPNLSKALGREAKPSQWGVLFLGSRASNQKPNPHQPRPRVQISTKGGEHFTAEEAALEGIVVLDGTWAQAKTMWWRNPWLLKLKRIVLNPAQRSLYGKLRKEPRRECLSTLESIAETLEGLGEDPAVSEALRTHFKAMLSRYESRK